MAGTLSYRVRVTSPIACPSCGAALRLGQPWCSLCYADLRPPAEPDSAPAAAPAPVLLSPGVNPEPTIVLEQGEAPTWPCTTCGAANPFDHDLCAGCGSAFLAAARDDAPLLELPVVGDLTRLGRGQRLGLAAGLVIAFLTVLFIVGLLLG